MKTIGINKELLEILLKIKTQSKSIAEWRVIESSDMFQSKHFSGGFDATEDEFTFSYYENESDEYWFQFSIDQLDEMISGKQKEIKIRISD